MLFPTTTKQFDTTVHNRTASVLHVRLTTPRGHQKTEKTGGQVSENEGDILRKLLVCSQIANIVTYLKANCDMLFSRVLDLYLTTHNTHNTNFHAPGRIPTRNPKKQAVVDPRLGSRGHWECVNLYRKYHNQDLKINFSTWQLVPDWADSCKRQS
jgi:hypothetical protein